MGFLLLCPSGLPDTLAIIIFFWGGGGGGGGGGGRGDSRPHTPLYVNTHRPCRKHSDGNFVVRAILYAGLDLPSQTLAACNSGPTSCIWCGILNQKIHE